MILTRAHGFKFKTALKILRMCEFKHIRANDITLSGSCAPLGAVKLNVGQNTDDEASRGFSSPYMAPWLENKYNMNRFEMSLNIPLLTDG